MADIVEHALYRLRQDCNYKLKICEFFWLYQQQQQHLTRWYCLFGNVALCAVFLYCPRYVVGWSYIVGCMLFAGAICAGAVQYANRKSPPKTYKYKRNTLSLDLWAPALLNCRFANSIIFYIQSAVDGARVGWITIQPGGWESWIAKLFLP